MAEQDMKDVVDALTQRVAELERSNRFMREQMAVHAQNAEKLTDAAHKAIEAGHAAAETSNAHAEIVSRLNALEGSAKAA